MTAVDFRDQTRNVILLEDIEDAEMGRFPGIRETEFQTIAGPKGEPLRPLKTSFKDPFGELHEGYVFRAEEDLTIIQVNPQKGVLIISIKRIGKIVGPKQDGYPWMASLKLLHVTDNIMDISKEFRPGVGAILKKLKNSTYTRYPTYAVKLTPDEILSIPELKCKRCGHSWVPRRVNLPKVCPKCKSPYWNKDRKK
jgi:hypothetical protein